MDPSPDARLNRWLATAIAHRRARRNAWRTSAGDPTLYRAAMRAWLDSGKPTTPTCPHGNKSITHPSAV